MLVKAIVILMNILKKITRGYVEGKVDCFTSQMQDVQASVKLINDNLR